MTTQHISTQATLEMAAAATSSQAASLINSSNTSESCPQQLAAAWLFKQAQLVRYGFAPQALRYSATQLQQDGASFCIEEAIRRVIDTVLDTTTITLNTEDFDQMRASLHK